MQQQARGLITGTQKHLANETLAFNGARFATQALIQVLQELIDVVTRSSSRAGCDADQYILRQCRICLELRKRLFVVVSG